MFQKIRYIAYPYPVTKISVQKVLKISEKIFWKPGTLVIFAYPYTYPITGYAEFSVSVSRVSVCFGTLTEGTIIEKYYMVVSQQNKRRLEFMARESSIQLVYQNAIIVYQFFHPPLFELDFTIWSNPGAMWVLSVMIQLLSGMV